MLLGDIDMSHPAWYIAAMVIALFLQSAWDRWKARGDKVELARKTEEAAEVLAIKTDNTAKMLATKTVEAADSISQRVESVEKVLNGGGLQGDVKSLGEKLDRHDREDQDRHKDVLSSLASLSRDVRGSRSEHRM